LTRKRRKSELLRGPTSCFLENLPAIALLLAIASPLVPPLGAADPVSPQQSRAFAARPEEELLLLAVRMDREVLTDTLVAYPFRSSVILPLGELMRLLDLAITTNVADRSASGFFISETRRFHLDVDGRKAIVDGRTFTFGAERAEVHQDDIYVDARLLSEWLPIEITVNLYASLVTVTPREPLPMQLRAGRERRVGIGLAGRVEGPSYPFADNKYNLFDGPFIDTSLVFERRPDTSLSNQVRHATYAAADLLFGQATAFVTGSDDDPFAESRFSWGRRDPSGSLLGPLRATEAIVGESSFPGLELIARATSGTGFLLTNYPLDRLNQFDQHTFRGELPPGWDVELYRNGALLDFQSSRPEGRYEFADVPVLFGMNIFRLVFYGPQGQVREEVETFNVGQSLVPRGEFRYRLAHADPRGLSRRSLSQFEYGIARNASVELALAEVGIGTEDRRFGRASLFASRQRWLGQLEAARDDDGGTLFGAGATTQFGNVGISIRYADLDRFESEDLLPRFGAMESRGELRLSGVLGSSRRLQLPFTAEIERLGLVEGGAAYVASNSISGFVYGLAATNRIQGTWFSGAREELRSFSRGSFILSRWRQGDSIRGEIGYEIEPDFKASVVQAIFETRRFEDYLLTAGVSRNVLENETIWLAGASKRAGAFGMTVNLDYSKAGLGARALLNVGIGRDRATGDWFSSARGLASSGAASVLVFRDDDGDGEMDPDEEPIPDVAFFINRASSPVLTDSSGEARFTSLPAYRNTDIAISAASLEDPYLIPTEDGYRFVPRPGKVRRFLFPVRMTGEITGTAWIVREGTLREASGIQLELVDSSGEIITVRSEYDGFFTIPRVFPGSYLLRVQQAQLERLSAAAEPKKIEIGPEGTVLDGVDVVIQPRDDQGEARLH
jgi:hypothetical protein